MSRIALPLVVLASALAAHGCGSKRADTEVEGGSGGDQVCYMELKVGYWCDDGDVNPGTWEVECAVVERSACNSDHFASGTEHDAGCDWETRYENHTWMPKAQCEEKQAAGLLLANGEECAYHEDCESGCCGSPEAGYVCVPCEP